MIFILEQFKKCKFIAKILYNMYAPWSIRYRRNIFYAKLYDYEVIALLLLQTLLGITTRTRFYRFIRNNKVIPKDRLPEESRFNRICNRNVVLLQIIRNRIIRDKVSPKYTIIDSLPIPLCNPIRRFRAKTLNQYANLGFNSTKQMPFYGFKGHFEVSNSGIILTYTVTKASVHDVKVATSLLQQYPSKYVLADKGYFSYKLQTFLKRKYINLWFPRHKNCKPDKYNDILLLRLRRHIESVFAQLKRLFNIERNFGKSLRGFQSRLEQILLTDTLLKLNLL